MRQIDGGSCRKLLILLSEERREEWHWFLERVPTTGCPAWLVITECFKGWTSLCLFRMESFLKRCLCGRAGTGGTSNSWTVVVCFYRCESRYFLFTKQSQNPDLIARTVLSAPSVLLCHIVDTLGCRQCIFLHVLRLEQYIHALEL